MSAYLKITIGALLLASLSTITPTTTSAQEGYWFTRADLPTARQEILPGALGDKIFVVGGWLATGGITDQVEYYDAVTDEWSSALPLPVDNHHCAVVGIDGLVYVIGGYINVFWPWRSTDVVLAYNPLTWEWTEKAPMIVGRGEHAVAVFDGKIYVTGGNDYDGNVVSVVEVYDPVADTWTQVADLPTPRHHHASAAVDSLIYVVGGRQGYWGTTYTMISMVEAYSPASNTWYSIGDMPYPRGGLSAAGMGDKLYIFGGEIPGIFEESEEYDPATDTWRLLTPMLTPRHGTAAAVVGDTAFIIGGGRVSGMFYDDSNEGFVLGTCTDDPDHDGYGDTDDPANTCPVDNCPGLYNPDQADNDGDGIGDACDDCTDSDGDTYGNPGFPLNTCPADNCPEAHNPDQLDTDGDTYGDACDECDTDPTKTEPGQCGCGVPDTDTDGDSIADCVDICPGADDLVDSDEDGIPDGCDNCRDEANPDQNDTDGNCPNPPYLENPGCGDPCQSCCTGRVGDANGSSDDEPTIGDLTVMIDALFIGNNWEVIPCLDEADINQSGGIVPETGDITIGDVSYLIDYLFIAGPEIGLADCL